MHPNSDNLSLSTRLAQYRDNLLDRQRRVEADLNRENGPIPSDFSDQAIAVENDETLIALKAELSMQIRQYNHALTKLYAGSYGVCDQCAENISEQRLSALPATALCAECAGNQA